MLSASYSTEKISMMERQDLEEIKVERNEVDEEVEEDEEEEEEVEEEEDEEVDGVDQVDETEEVEGEGNEVEELVEVNEIDGADEASEDSLPEEKEIGKVSKKKKKNHRDVAKIRNEYVAIPMNARIRKPKNKKFIRLPRAPPIEQHEKCCTKDNIKPAVGVLILLAFGLGGYFLLTVDGPVSRVFWTMLTELSQLAEWKGDDTAHYIPSDDVTKAPEPTTKLPEAGSTTMRTLPPPTPRAPPSQAVPIATKEIDGNIYYFFHNEYKLENARKMCYERFNKSRLLYVRDRAETQKIAEWYYADIYDNIRDWEMDAAWIKVYGTADPPIRLMWTTGYADFRDDFKTTVPHEMSSEEYVTKNRLQWVGVPNATVTREFVPGAFCDDWMRSVNQDAWLTLNETASRNSTLEESQQAAQIIPYFQLHLGIKMNRISELDESPGCLMWQWLLNKDALEKTKLPFICKRPVLEEIPKSDEYRRDYIITNWLQD